VLALHINIVRLGRPTIPMNHAQRYSHLTENEDENTAENARELKTYSSVHYLFLTLFFHGAQSATWYLLESLLLVGVWPRADGV
jgi:hypothetical protein